MDVLGYFSSTDNMFDFFYRWDDFLRIFHVPDVLGALPK
jgi:hypothetical protein